MGQKCHPMGFRVGITRPWSSRWYARKKDYGRLLVEDRRIRDFVRAQLPQAGISKIEIERGGDETTVQIFTSRPGAVIGKKGEKIDSLREDLRRFAPGGAERKVQVLIREIAKPEVDAQLVAEGIGEQLLKRASFRRVMKKSVETALAQGALGIKIVVGGRLGGAEIARSEKYMAGMLPLHTLDADISYGFAEARTTYGIIGIKVWLYKGKIVKEAASAPNA